MPGIGADLDEAGAAAAGPVPLRSTRTFEKIVSRIRGMILDGALKPGDKLPPERDLSAQFGISRNAVREALRALEQAGIVDLRPGKGGGAFVTAGRPEVIGENMHDLLQLGSISFDNLWETRLLLADIMVRLAVERMTADDMAALEANVMQAKRFYDSGQLYAKSRCNIDFHDTLALATKNPMLTAIMAGVSDLVRHFIKRLGSDPGIETLLSRDRFLAALRAKDVQAAQAEMRHDLIRVHQFYQTLGQTDPTALLAKASGL